jgi:hypothetical protein
MNRHTQIKNKTPIDLLVLFINNTSIKYNIDKKNIIKDFLNYIIRNYSKYVNTQFLEFVENLLHSQVQNNNIYINYSLTQLSSFISL